MTENDWIREKALSLGFDDCGVARAEELPQERVRLESWLAAGRAAGLGYMSRNVDKRCDPTLLVEGARSVVVCAVSYHRAPAVGEVAARIATYALARDYHTTIREKLEALFAEIRGRWPQVQGRVFVDTAPLLEKAWAVRAGLGWIGRHSLLIHPRFGSFVLLGELVLDLDLAVDPPYTANGCGGCRSCIEACPVGAIGEDRMLHTERCISRLSIEKNPPQGADLKGWIWGCDLCQRACPHNAKAPMLSHPQFAAVAGIETLTLDEWEAMSGEERTARFGDTPFGASRR